MIANQYIMRNGQILKSELGEVFIIEIKNKAIWIIESATSRRWKLLEYKNTISDHIPGVKLIMNIARMATGKILRMVIN